MSHNKEKSSRWNTPIILALSLVVGFPTISHAIATYDAITLVDLTITGAANSSGTLTSKPNDLLISGDTRVIDADAIVSGNALADQFADAMVIGNNPNNLDLNDSLSQQTIATGEAAMGTATSFAFTQGLLSINNLSFTNSYTVNFVADWSYFVETSITNPISEFAFAISEIHLESLVLGSLLDITVSSDSDFGGGLFSDMRAFPYSVLLAPGESDVLTLTVDAFGTGDASNATPNTPVPEPSTFALMLIGLIGMALRLGGKRQSSNGLSTQPLSSKC